MIYGGKKRTYLCWRCLNWEKCVKYRYSNIRLKRMKKIERDIDSYGCTVIYVNECDKFRLEIQDVPHKKPKEWDIFDDELM